MARLARLTRRWSDATGDGAILRHLVEADWPGYYDWADARADLTVARPPAVPRILAEAVSSTAPEALAALGLLANET
eukprot:10773765-Alexandrium_andersonii.AAC.1